MRPTDSAEADATEADAGALFTMIDTVGPATIRVRPTDYCRGPWDHGFLHGGPLVGLAAWAAEQRIDAADDLLCSRLTVELLSAVPLTELDVTATVVKPGGRSRVVGVEVAHGGRVVVRASSQWLRPTPRRTRRSANPPARPSEVADPGAAGFDYPRPGFNCDASELRYVSGSNEESGPGTIWTRLTSPLIAGRPTSPFCRVATVADLAAAAGWEEGPNGAHYINPDLTMQLSRYPSGPWIAIDAAGTHAPLGVGYNEAALFDDEGPIGRVLQSLVESPIVMDLPIP